MALPTAGCEANCTTLLLAEPLEPISTALPEGLCAEARRRTGLDEFGQPPLDSGLPGAWRVDKKCQQFGNCCVVGLAEGGTLWSTENCR